MSIGQLTQLQITDLRRIKFVNLDIQDSQLTKIKGPNEAGKSTVLDALKFAFEGAAAIPEGVIRNGIYSEGMKSGNPIDTAKISAETSGGYKIERVIRTDKKGNQKTTLKVTDPDGKPVPGGPQEFLNSVSARMQDPMMLAELSMKELWPVLIDNSGIDFTPYETRIEEAREELKLLRRQKKGLGDPVSKPKDPKPEGAADPKEAFAKASEAYKAFQEKSSALRHAQEAEENLAKDRVELVQRIAKLQEQLIGVEDRIKENAATLKEIAPAVEKLEADYNEKQQKADSYSQLQDSLVEWERYEHDQEQRAEIESKMEAFTTKESNAKAEMAKAAANAEFAYFDLLIDDEGVVTVFEDDIKILWDNLSTSKRIEVAAHLCAGLLPEDGLRHMYIHRGESLGTERMRELAELAKRLNFHLFVEVVQESPDNDGVYIEDGEITVQSEPESNRFENLNDLF